MKWYKYDIRKFSDAEYIKWYSLMSEEKKKRVDRFRFADDKKRTVAGEMLARKAIAQWSNILEEDIVFDKNEYGKPFAVGLNVQFNISHSSDMVVCAVDDKPVGIDIEQIRPIDLKVAKRICTDDELIYLFGHTPLEEDFCYTTDLEILRRFFELWTAKEAFGKCRGTGIAELSCTPNDILQDTVEKFFFEGYVVTVMRENYCNADKKKLQANWMNFLG